MITSIKNIYNKENKVNFLIVSENKINRYLNKNEKMESKKLNIEMADMVGKTYFKVATWYNQDFGSEKERQEALKHVCVEMIQQILEDTVLQMEGISNTGVETIKKTESVNIVNSHPAPSGMFQVNEEAIIKGLNGL